MTQQSMVKPAGAHELPTGGMAAQLLRDRETVSTALIHALADSGLRYAFGMVGGAIVPFFHALLQAPIELVHCRHESGAVFAAVEASLVSDAPTLVFVTTGPGLTNALTAAVTARFEGAKLLLISAVTPLAKRGRYPIQESSAATLGAGIYDSAGMFDYAVAMHDANELPGVVRALRRGFARPQGFVAHVALPLPVQASPAPVLGLTVTRAEPGPSQATLDAVVERLRGRFAVWIGHGARHVADKLALLVERTGAPVLCTPRAKGVFPEQDPRFLGVSGLGGHEQLVARVGEARVERLLVLGSRLGELSSSYERGLIPRGGLVHVDLDPSVPGSAFPDVETLAVQSEIGLLLDGLLERADELGGPRVGSLARASTPVLRLSEPPLTPREQARVRPRLLMQCIQTHVVEGSDAVILSETGNSLAWTNRYLSMPSPGRYRMSGMFCPMGHVSAGALGVALAGRKAVAVVGDGAFLMQNEVSTAVAQNADVLWIVLNDARYGMCDQGLRCLGYGDVDLRIPEVDFVGFARSLGADGRRVVHECDLDAALAYAMRARGPFVLDVVIDPNELAPVANRIASIYTQTSGEA